VFTAEAAALPQKKRALRGRRLVAVDIENVAGGAVMTQAMADWARVVVETALEVSDGEQVVIGTSHVGLFNTKAAWPSARVRIRSGPDGADIELLDVLANERIYERFDEVVLVSGDGVFADVVARLGGRGVQVTVASWSISLAARLRLAAKRTVYLDGWVNSRTYKELA
jgi:NYN domain